MSNIRSIVEGSVPSEYRTQAQPVVDRVVGALEEALAQSLATLVRSARGAGVSAAQIEEALVQCGLKERQAPEPVVSETPTVTDEIDLSRQVSDLTAIVTRLVSAAEARGLHI